MNVTSMNFSCMSRPEVVYLHLQVVLWILNGADDGLEALALLPADVFPGIVELNAVPTRLAWDVPGDRQEILLVLTQGFVEHVNLVGRPTATKLGVLVATAGIGEHFLAGPEDVASIPVEDL